MSFVQYGRSLVEDEKSDLPFVKYGRSLLDEEQEETEPQKQEDNLLEMGVRKAVQPAIGYASATPYGLLTQFIEQVGKGEAIDPLEIERLKEISEREGVPFDEEKYLEAAHNAGKFVPTPSNIASVLEEYTGLPLEAKDKVDKFLRMAGGATKLSPKDATFRGMNTPLPKPVLGTGVATTAEGLKAIGLPEPLADLASFAILKTPSADSSGLSIKTKTKPSGFTERQFEKTVSPKEISEKKFIQINEKIEEDFRNILQKSIEESPIGETAKILKENPTFIQESRELLNEAQEVANKISKSTLAKDVKKQLVDSGKKQQKGFVEGEYDKNFKKFMNQSAKDIKGKDITPGQLVEQYRKNNASLSEYFEPGASKALNRAKFDSFLEQNTIIANNIEKIDPELGKLFREGNQRWTKIKDVQAVDEFVNEIFSEKVNYKKLHDFFDKEGYGRTFKRALGEKGYKEFEQLSKDLLSTELPYKMLKVAEKQGFMDLSKHALNYFIHPKIGITKFGYDVGKNAWRILVNSMLDKPQLVFEFRTGIKNLNAGKFAEAEKQFEKITKSTQPRNIKP